MIRYPLRRRYADTELLGRSGRADEPTTLIEQVLTGWIFDLLPQGEEEFEQAKQFVVETVCGGLDAGRPRS